MESWLSVHMFYEQPWEKLLLQVVKPACQELYRQKLISRFFFIRYGEGGPHIRLRVKGETGVLKKYAEPLISNYFQLFTSSNPSIRKETGFTKTLLTDNKWYPNNTMQLISYEPETERYGGIHGLPIAEKQFEISSKAVLEAITESKIWNSSRALGVAIQMHVSFMYAIGISQEEAIHFFSWIAHRWLPRAYYHEPSFSKEDHKKARNKTLSDFGEQYCSQKSYLLPFCLNFLEKLEFGSTFGQAWVNQWVTENMCMHTMLNNQYESGNLVKPSLLFYPVIQPVNATLWSLYDSFIHMTNNRLGVVNKDEAFIAFLIKEVLSEKVNISC